MVDLPYSSSKYEPPTLHSFPSEILTQIFSNIPGKDLKSIMLSCKRFSSIISDNVNCMERFELCSDVIRLEFGRNCTLSRQVFVPKRRRGDYGYTSEIQFDYQMNQSQLYSAAVRMKLKPKHLYIVCKTFDDDILQLMNAIEYSSVPIDYLIIKMDRIEVSPDDFRAFILKVHPSSLHLYGYFDRRFIQEQFHGMDFLRELFSGVNCLQRGLNMHSSKTISNMVTNWCSSKETPFNGILQLPNCTIASGELVPIVKEFFDINSKSAREIECTIRIHGIPIDSLSRIDSEFAQFSREQTTVSMESVITYGNVTRTNRCLEIRLHYRSCQMRIVLETTQSPFVEVMPRLQLNGSLESRKRSATSV